MRLLAAVAVCAGLIVAPAASAGSFVDVSFSNARDAWALVAEPCQASAARCTAVETTTDGGRVWRRLASLPGGLERISRQAGMAFGQAAFVASDGGRRWQRVRHLAFESVVPAAGATFALTYSHSGCPAACAVALRRAASGSSVFTRIPAFRNPSYGYGDTLVGAGANLYAVGFGHVSGGAQGAYARIAISRDDGRSWSVRGDPCRDPGATEVDSTQVVAAGTYVALLCVVRTTGAGSIALSRDAGRTFARLRPPITGGYANQLALDAAGDLAVLDTVGGATGHSADRLTLSYDGGTTWRVALRRRSTRTTALPPSLTLFGRSLRWLVSGRTLLRSDDGGRTWQSTSAP
ncbi:MAG: hypothetical protein M3Q31_13985 [Actinomycetota bacterium]|nr:hypothetical protein [Actinomycetota bacterium]